MDYHLLTYSRVRVDLNEASEIIKGIFDKFCKGFFTMRINRTATKGHNWRVNKKIGRVNLRISYFPLVITNSGSNLPT